MFCYWYIKMHYALDTDKKTHGRGSLVHHYWAVEYGLLSTASTTTNQARDMEGERWRERDKETDRTESERKIDRTDGREREREDRTVTFALRSLTKRGWLTATSTATAKGIWLSMAPCSPHQLVLLYKQTNRQTANQSSRARVSASLLLWMAVSRALKYLGELWYKRQDNSQGPSEPSGQDVVQGPGGKVLDLCAERGDWF